LSKITAYGSLSTPQPDDVLPIVDVHDTTMAPTGTTKKITVGNLMPVDWVNVTHAPYNADPTGSVDSTAAIQAAWDSGKPVYMPAGDYLVCTGGTSLTWQAGLVVFGDYAGTYPGEDTITGVTYLHRAASANCDVIQVPDGTNYGRIQDIAIDGNKSNNSSGIGMNIEDGASGQETQIIIERCFFHDNPGSNLYLGSNRRANKVQYGVFNYSGSDGITVCGSDNLIMSNIIGSNARAGINLGSTVTQNWASFGSNTNSTTTHIFNNDIYGNNVGIAIPSNATRSMIVGNGIDRNNYQGITVYNDDCNVIIGNAFHSNGQAANNTYAHIDLASGVTGVVIDDNTFGPLDSGVSNLCSYCVDVESWSGSGGIIAGNIGQADTASPDTVGGLVNSQSNTVSAVRLSNAGALIQGSGNDVLDLRNSSGTLITKVTNGGTLAHTGGAMQLSGHFVALLSTLPGVANGTYCTGAAIGADSSDIAGLISATMTASPAAGSLIVVTFHTAFTNTPAVVITPSNIYAAQITTYVTVTNSGFTVAAATTPPAGVDSQAVSWDYAVTGQNA